MKGGYKLIDLKNQNLVVDSSITIKGIYESIENSYHKPLILCGIVIDDVEKNDTFITPILNGDDYVCTIYEKTLTITNQDLITLSEKGE